MTKRALTVMAVILVAATAVTAASAFADAQKTCRTQGGAVQQAPCNIGQQISQQVSQSSEAILQLKMRNLHGKRLVAGIKIPRLR